MSLLWLPTITRRSGGGVFVPPVEPDPPPSEANADPPEFIDATELSFPDDPVTITEGGTYSDLRIAATGTDNCVTISTSDLVRFEDCDFRFERGNGIAWGADVEVDNCRFFGMYPTTEGHQIGRSITTEATRLVVEHSLTQRATMYVDKAKTAGEYVFRYNIGRNIDSRKVNAQGEPVYDDNDRPEWRQFIQLNKGTDPTVANTETILIEWNEVWCDPGSGFPGDIVNFYGVGGSDGNPAMVRWNLLNGAWPMPLDWNSYTGGGLMAGDGQGAYIIREHNWVLNTTNYGIAIAGGRYSIIRDNRVLRTGHAGDDETALVDRDVGIYVRDYSSTPDFGDHEVNDNYIAWQMADGSFSNLSITEGAATQSGNTLVTTGDITQAEIEAEVIAFREAAIAEEIEIGPTRV